MAERITRKVLEGRLEHLNKAIGAKAGDAAYMELDICSWGGCDYKIECENGSANVSPRGTAKETYNFINGMLTGIQMLTSYA